MSFLLALLFFVEQRCSTAGGCDTWPPNTPGTNVWTLSIPLLADKHGQDLAGVLRMLSRRVVMEKRKDVQTQP